MKWGGSVGYSPLKAPTTACGYTDEFDDASLSGSWTEWDQAAYLTVSETTLGLEITAASNATLKLGGIFKDAPASPYSITTLVGLYANQATDIVRAGILLGQSLGGSPSTSNELVWGYDRGINLVRLQSHLDYQTGSSTDISVSFAGASELHSGIYLRVRLASNILRLDYSWDGIGYIAAGSQTAPWTPSNIGLHMDIRNPSPAKAFFPFFRVTSSACVLDIPGGGR